MRKACVDTVPAAPLHKLVCVVDTDLPFEPVNNRWFTSSSRRYSAGAGLQREDLMHKVMCPASLSGPPLLSVTLGSPQSHRFSSWNLHTDCAISCDCLYAEANKYSTWDCRSLRFVSVPLLYTRSRLVNIPQPVSSQSPLSLGMLSDNAHCNDPFGCAWAHRAQHAPSGRSAKSGTCKLPRQGHLNFRLRPSKHYIGSVVT